MNAIQTGRMPDGSEFDLRIEQDVITVEMSRGSRVPDPKWSFTDSNGHTHTADSGTWGWVVTGGYWCDDCRDEHDTGENRCLECGEPIEVRWKELPPEPPQHIAGLVSGTLTVKRASLTTGYMLQGDDFEIPWQDDRPAQEWFDKVTSREPIEMKVESWR